MKDNCDPDSGFCAPGDLNDIKSKKTDNSKETQLIYVGDPMCSWCYGFAPNLKTFRAELAEKGISFKLVLGGLRPGGGDPWNQEFKDFLKHHWEAVNQRSGQPFSYDLFDLPVFNYDTEPACRAVILSRKWIGDKDIEFYDEVQKGFYMESKDPGNVTFYQSICEKFGIPFDEFKALFASDFLKVQTREEFMQSRAWGIQGYPTLLLKKGEELSVLSNGYMELEQLKSTFEKY